MVKQKQQQSGDTSPVLRDDMFTYDVVKVKTMPCFHCNKTSVVTVPKDGYEQWKAGTYVQEAFPEMKSETRELLVSGTHPECWLIIFADDEGDDCDES